MFMLSAPTASRVEGHFVLVVMALALAAHAAHQECEPSVSSSHNQKRSLEVLVWNSLRQRWLENNNLDELQRNYEA
jgi:hypothetical protein